MGVNHYQKFTRRGTRYITAEGKNYTGKILVELEKHRDKFKNLLKENETTEAKGFKMSIILNQSNYFTKKGKLSLTAGDVDGPIKIIIDTFFKFIDINDAHLLEVTARKQPSDLDSFVVRFESKY